MFSPTLPEIPTFKGLLWLISKNKQKNQIEQKLIHNNVGYQKSIHLVSFRKKVIFGWANDLSFGIEVTFWLGWELGGRWRKLGIWEWVLSGEKPKSTLEDGYDNHVLQNKNQVRGFWTGPVAKCLRHMEVIIVHWWAGLEKTSPCDPCGNQQAAGGLWMVSKTKVTLMASQPRTS